MSGFYEEKKNFDLIPVEARYIGNEDIAWDGDWQGLIIKEPNKFGCILFKQKDD